ncbi:Uncharacterised protein [uncultured archaeon]|nr:Uncharacterised protein [uncultured archaeon]
MSLTNEMLIDINSDMYRIFNKITFNIHFTPDLTLMFSTIKRYNVEQEIRLNGAYDDSHYTVTFI